MAAESYLVMTNVPPSKWCATVGEHRQLIGRAVDADIKVPAEHLGVSRRHAEIWADKSAIWIQDLGSTSGTRVNNVQLQPGSAFQLDSGDRIWVGGVELDLVRHLDPFTELQAALQHAKEEGDTVKLRRQQLTATFEWQKMVADLTHAELEVLLWMARGYSSLDEIAAKLYRSPHTVRTHLGSIFRKLDVHSREELLATLQRFAKDNMPS